jgi:hypothetical protein
MAQRPKRFGETFADVRTIPGRRDVLRRRRVIERMPLAEKLEIGHLQFDSVAPKMVQQLVELCPGALATGALFSRARTMPVLPHTSGASDAHRSL